MTKLADLIWKNVELLRGAFKENEYRKVILPFTILRRLDCVVAPSRGYPFFNISSFTLREVAETPDDVRDNLEASHNRRRRTRLHRRANRLPGRAADGIK